MKFNSEHLITELAEITRQNMNEAEKFKLQDIQTLNWKSSPERWSVLECLEHLNRYGDYYLPELSARLKTSLSNNQPVSAKNSLFKSGTLGNYFANSMKYKEKLNTMKTFSSMNPVGSQLTVQTLEKFLDQQKSMLDLLEKARSINLTKTKTSISISKFIKLRIGDTFRVVIYHNERHIKQALKAIQNSANIHSSVRG